VQPALGRTFVAAEEQPDAPATVILSHGLWVRRFGGDPAIVGRIRCCSA
jgi:putative ABC transport system permease protein